MSDGGIAAILVVERSLEACGLIAAPLEAAGYGVIPAYNGSKALEAIYADPPQCIVVPHGHAGSADGTLLDDLKGDSVYGHLPVIVTVSAEELAQIDWARVRADDYLVTPVDDAELVSRVRLCLARAQRDLNANPLTGLPGNLAILREAERRLAAGQPFAVAYLDLDHFKPFNDKYGFSRGDEVLRMTARILVNAIRRLNNPDTCIGHVGGDDFLFMTPSALMEQACKDVLRDFDLIVPNFYDEADRASGQILSVSRTGEQQTFPLMSCSIAVVDAGAVEVQHLADISSRSAEVKKYAKGLPGSNYLMDRRK